MTRDRISEMIPDCVSNFEEKPNWVQNLFVFGVLITVFIIVGYFTDNLDASYFWAFFTGIIGLGVGVGFRRIINWGQEHGLPQVYVGLILFAVLGAVVGGVSGGLFSLLLNHVPGDGGETMMIAQGAFSATVIFSAFSVLIGFDWSKLGD